MCAAGQGRSDVVDVDHHVVRRLLAAQFPQWAQWPMAAESLSGRDNAIYRLGDDLAVRLPRRPLSAGHLINEQRWLPDLAPRVPLNIPVPVGLGRPGQGYPWPWTVCRWLPGRIGARAPVDDPIQTAAKLATFVAAMQAIDTSTGPASDLRGGPLASRDEMTRASIDAVSNRFDPDVLSEAWDAALAVPEWTGQPVWLHGDLHPANLLVAVGELSAVIDFGLLAVGDPACDLMVAWTYLPGHARRTFRAGVGADDPTWARGRGWALSIGLMISALMDDDPVLSAIGRHTIDAVLHDHERG